MGNPVNSNLFLRNLRIQRGSFVNSYKYGGFYQNEMKNCLIYTGNSDNFKYCYLCDTGFTQLRGFCFPKFSSNPSIFQIPIILKEYWFNLI